MAEYIDLTGQKFGKLIVLRRIDDYIFPKGSKTVRYECLCECGTIKAVTGNNLRSGNTTSCGCYKKEVAIHNMPDNKKHGLSHGRLYGIYVDMKRRCYEEHNSHYSNYGGRGIRVCDEWLEDNTNFFTWALENGYSDDLTLDRIDVNGNYEPSNCRWTTWKEQLRNRRDTVKYTINGEEKSLREWCEIYKIRFGLVYGRIAQGMTVEEALLRPIRKYTKKKRG